MRGTHAAGTLDPMRMSILSMLHVCIYIIIIYIRINIIHCICEVVVPPQKGTIKSGSLVVIMIMFPNLCFMAI